MRFLFFFKHKTAYDLRISDWSSDVCSSDLTAPSRHARTRHVNTHDPLDARIGFPPSTNAMEHPQPRQQTANSRSGRRGWDQVLRANAAQPNSLSWTATSLNPAAARRPGRVSGSMRSEERRVGKEGVSTYRTRWSADP